MNQTQFAKFHKKQTGYSLKSEQLTGEVSDEPMTPERRAQLLAEVRAYRG